jgi:peptide-methionine (S)-S-oxide reductase
MNTAKKFLFSSLFLCVLSLIAHANQSNAKMPLRTTNMMDGNVTEFALVGGGCFWCTEAVFEKLDGVIEVISGYAGGETNNPTYKEICTGKTGHAEVIRIKFDPRIISFSEILQIFGNAHDPTTLNRQGADVGTQYRSTVMFFNEEQKEIAHLWKEKLSKSLVDPVVTEIVPAPRFYPAEEYHQDFYFKNPNQGYCSFVIRPKLKKLGLE